MFLLQTPSFVKGLAWRERIGAFPNVFVTDKATIHINYFIQTMLDQLQKLHPSRIKIINSYVHLQGPLLASPITPVHVLSAIKGTIANFTTSTIGLTIAAVLWIKLKPENEEDDTTLLQATRIISCLVIGIITLMSSVALAMRTPPLARMANIRFLDYTPTG